VLFATNYLTELAHSKLKHGLFSRVLLVVMTAWLKIVRIVARNIPRTRTQALIDDESVSRASSSLQESDGVVFSVRWGAFLLKHKKIIPDNLRMPDSDF